MPCFDGFCIENAPAAGPVHSVTGASPGSLWAAGEGVLLRYQGGRWDTACARLAGLDLWSSHAASDGDVWVAGDRVLGHFDGASWLDTPSPLGEQVPNLWSRAGEAFALDFSGRIARWDGVRWTTVYDAPFASQTFEGLWGDGLGNAWAVNGAGLLAWNGAAWSAPVRPFNVNDVWAPPGGPAWFAGFTFRDPDWWTHDAAVASRQADGSYLARPLPAPYWEAKWVRGSGPDDVWVGAIAGDAYSSTGDVLRWDGTAWSKVPWPGSSPWPPPLVLGPAQAFLASQDWDSALSRSVDRIWSYGASGWAPMLSFDPPYLAVVSGSGAADVWAAGSDFAAWHYDGAAWRRARAASDGSVAGLSAGAPGSAWLVGADAKGGGRVLRWGGSAFSETAFSRRASAVFARGAEAWVTVDGDDAAGVSARVEHWDGASWTELDTGAAMRASGVWAAGPGDVWAVGSYVPGQFARSVGVVLHFDGARWDRRDLPDHPVAALWGSGPGDVWLAASTEDCAKCLPITPDAVVLHWDGHAFANTAGVPLYTLSGTGPGDVWGATLEWPAGRSGPQSSV
ncbi:MAG TPA: hypothetical protein VF400_00250, partial [Anaeromyxobacteraceae bacterium]